MEQNTGYRKITKAELQALGFVFPAEKYKQHVAFARQYYPGTATSMVMVMNSEYNDQSYENSLQYILVYDKNGDELLPYKDLAKNCRSAWMDLPIPGVDKYNNESNEQLDDIVIPLSVGIPELYIKQ